MSRESETCFIKGGVLEQSIRENLRHWGKNQKLRVYKLELSCKSCLSAHALLFTKKKDLNNSQRIGYSFSNGDWENYKKFECIWEW